MKLQISARNRAYHFTAGAGEPILLAGLRSGLELPYECGSGTCGTCKAVLLDGEVEDGWPQAPATRLLKPGARELLMCQCVARSDVSLRLATPLHETAPGTCRPDHIGARIAACEPVAPDVLELRLALDGETSFDAGQFMLLAAPGIPGYRGYSMVDYAPRTSTLRFVVKRKPGGAVSEWLFGPAREGDRLRLFGPLGHAVFHPSLDSHLLCICGGSGIAGILCILARAARAGYFARRRGHVFFGVRRMEDAFFLDELAALVREAGGALEVTVALSEEAAPHSHPQHPELRFAQGLVHEVAAGAMQSRFDGVRAYLAGPPPAVDAAIRMLLVQARLTTDNIRYDKFS